MIPVSELIPEVEETEDFLVYLVDSESSPGTKWRVDLQKYNANGECACKGFGSSRCINVNGVMMTRKQALELRAMPNEQLECPHISLVKRYLMFKVLNEIIERRNDEAEKNKTKARQGSVGKKQNKEWPDDANVPF
jgi:hypothetical protein